jgi:hypothetical protein
MQAATVVAAETPNRLNRHRNCDGLPIGQAMRDPCAIPWGVFEPIPKPLTASMFRDCPT